MTRSDADFAAANVAAVRHYLARAAHLLERVAADPGAERLLATRLAPDMFDTAFHLAVAIGFGARALCPPAGLDVPETPEDPSLDDLGTFLDAVTARTGPIQAADLTRNVRHRAGEAMLQHDPADYIALFALPNMIFHLTCAYAGLRQGGMALGKADFDGMHLY